MHINQVTLFGDIVDEPNFREVGTTGVLKLTVKTEGRRMEPKMDAAWDGEGRYEWLGRVIEYQIGPKRTTDLEVLQDRLEELYKADDERPATIDSRPGTTYGDVVPVLDAAIFAGYTDITFVGEYKN